MIEGIKAVGLLIWIVGTVIVGAYGLSFAGVYSEEPNKYVRLGGAAMFFCAVVSAGGFLYFIDMTVI
jgi:hypothetical protein